MSDPESHPESGAWPSWLVKRRSLSVVGSAAGLVLGAAGTLWLHLATSGASTSAGSPHDAAGDFVFFGLVSVLVVGAAIVVLRRIRADVAQRGSLPGNNAPR